MTRKQTSYGTVKIIVFFFFSFTVILKCNLMEQMFVDIEREMVTLPVNIQD